LAGLKKELPFSGSCVLSFLKKSSWIDFLAKAQFRTACAITGFSKFNSSLFSMFIELGARMVSTGGGFPFLLK